MVTGNHTDYGSAVAVDVSGARYLAGVTNSTDIQSTPGAVNLTGNSNTLAFVRKVSPDGSKILYTAILGSASNAIALKVDTDGNLIVAFNGSYTPFSGGFISSPNAGIAVVKLSSSGDRLLYSARVIENGGNVAVEADDSGIYVAAGSGRITVSKLDRTGSSQIYQYTLPVTDFENTLAGIALLPDRSLYLAGTTHSLEIPTTPGSLKPSTTNPQNGHGFLIRLAPDGKSVTAGTYISGDYVDTTDGVAVDAQGNVTVVGTTASPQLGSGLPVTAIGFTALDKNSGYGYVLKVTPDLSKTVYGALLQFKPTAVRIDSSLNACLAGIDLSGTIVAKLDSSGTKFTFYATMPHRVQTTSTNLALDSSGAVWIAGTTNSAAVPDVTVVPYSPSTMLFNAYFARIDPSRPAAQLVLTSVPDATAKILPGQNVTFRLTIRNLGPSAAADVVLTAPEIPYTSFYGCRTSGQGACPTNLRFPHVTFPFIAPGATEQVELKLSTTAIQTKGTAYVFAFFISTSTSDLNRPAMAAENPLVVDYVAIAISGSRSTVYQLNGSSQNIPASSFPLFVTPNTTLQVLWPFPQYDSLTGRLLTFQRWSDGNTDNPRTIQVGATDASYNAVFTSSLTPVITAGGAVNAASFLGGSVAPGEEVALFGINLSSGSGSAKLDANGRIATQINDTTLLFDGIPAPLLYASPTQVSAIVPYEVGGQNSANVVLQRTGFPPASITLPVAPSAPGLYTVKSSGWGQLVAFNQDGSLNSPANPANPGDIVTLYGTGEGLTNPVPANGAIAGSPAPQPQLPIAVTVGNVPATAVYAGGSPQSTAGLFQLNLRLPPLAPSGSYIPVQFSAGANKSQTGATIAIGHAVPQAVPLTSRPSVDLSRPTISLLKSSGYIAAGSPDTTILVSGTGFAATSLVCWNGQPRDTKRADIATLLQDVTLQATLTAQDLATPALGYVSLCDAASSPLSDSMPLIVYLPLLNSDSVFDPLRQLIYAAIPQQEGGQAASIAVVDPATGTVQKSYPLGKNALALSISDDSQYLFVGLDHFVRRIRLDSWIADPDVEVGGNVHAVSPLPGQPSSFIVSASFMSVFDGGKMRPKTWNGGTSQFLGGPDASTIYAPGLYIIQLDSAGIAAYPSFDGLVGGAAVYSGGLIYDGNGNVVDPVKTKLLAAYGSSFGLVCPMPALQRVLFLGANGLPGDTSTKTSELSLFDTSSAAALWTISLPSTVSAISATRLVHWGADGFAFRFGAGLVLFRLSIP